MKKSSILFWLVAFWFVGTIQAQDQNVCFAGKEGDAPEPLTVTPLTEREICGIWKAEKIGDNEVPVDDLYIYYGDKGFTVEGKYKDWHAAANANQVTETSVTIWRKPKAEEMSDKAPQWAREKIAAEGKLEWKLALKAESRKGEWVMEGKWHPGQFKWSENGWSETGESDEASRKASYLDEGKPVDVRFKKAPTILGDPIVLDNQTGVNNGQPCCPYGGGSRLLFLCGINLPTNWGQKIDIRGTDDTIRYELLALPTDNNLNSDRKRFFKAGWDQMVKGLDRETEKTVRKCGAILVRAGLQGGVVPGVKKFSVNNMATSWRLRFGDNGAVITFARDINANENEDIDCACLPEKIYIEIRTETLFSTREIPLKAQLCGKDVSWNGSDTIVAKYVKDVTIPQADPEHPKVIHVYRTAAIQLGGEASSAGNGYHLPAKAGDTLETRPDDYYLFVGRPSIASVKIWDAPDRDADANLISTWEQAVENAAVLDGFGKDIKAGKSVLGKEAASISNVVFSNVAIGKLRPTKDAWTESTSHWTSIFPPALAARFFFGDRGILTERVSVTVADHAALLLYKEAFIRKMSTGLGSLEKKTKDLEWAGEGWRRVVLVGLRESLKRSAAKESSPWESVRVPGPDGGDVKMSWALDDGLRKAACKGCSDARADDWSLEAVANGFQQYQDAVRHAIQKAKDTPDEDVKKLIELIGYSYENLTPELLQRMMWHPPGASNQNWEPNHDARYVLWNLHTAADAIRAQEDLSKLDTQMALLAASAFAAPFMLSTNVYVMTACYAFDCATLGGQLISETIPEFREQIQRDEIRFAIGASLVLGTERLNEAELKKTEWFQTVLNVLPSALGVTMGGEALHSMTRANAKVKSALVADIIEKQGLEGAKRLTSSEKTAVLIASSEAETLKEMGATKVMQQSHERVATMTEKIAAEAGISRKMRAEAKTNVVKATGNAATEKVVDSVVGQYASVEEKTQKAVTFKAPEQKATGAVKTVSGSTKEGVSAKDATTSVKQTEPVGAKDSTTSVKQTEPVGAKDATGSVKQSTESVKEETQSVKGETQSVKETGTGTVKDAVARPPSKSAGQAAEDLDDIEALVKARGDKDPEQNPVNAQVLMPDNTAETFGLGRQRGKGQFATVYDVVTSKWKDTVGLFKDAVVKFVWDGDIFRTPQQIANDMVEISKKLTDAKILHLEIRQDIKGCANAKTMRGDPLPFVVQRKLPTGAKVFSEGTDPNVIVGWLRGKGRGRATAKLFFDLKEAGLVLEDPRVCNLFWQEINGEWACGILDVDRVIPFRERNTRLGTVIDWVEAHVSRDTVKSLYAARRRGWNNTQSAIAFANRAAEAPVGPYFPDAEFFMEKMFEHKNWLECDLIDAAGNVVPAGRPLSEVKGVRYRNGFLSIDDVREFFPNFDDPARWKELDLRNPYRWKGALLRVPEFIFRTATAAPRPVKNNVASVRFRWNWPDPLLREFHLQPGLALAA